MSRKTLLILNINISNNLQVKLYCNMSKSKLFLPPSNESYFSLRGPSTLTGELRTGDCKTTLEAKKKIGNLTYYMSSESL